MKKYKLLILSSAFSFALLSCNKNNLNQVNYNKPNININSEESINDIDNTKNMNNKKDIKDIDYNRNINNEKNTKNIDDNIKTKNEKLVYTKSTSKKLKKYLKTLPKYDDMKDEEKKNFLIITNSDDIINIENWNKFQEDVNNNKATDIIILQFTVEGDEIFTYVSFSNNKFFYMIDSTRDKWGVDKYSKGVFKYMKTFNSFETKSVYLFNDNDITEEQLMNSLLSSNSADWIEHLRLFSIPNNSNNNNITVSVRNLLNEDKAIELIPEDAEIIYNFITYEIWNDEGTTDCLSNCEIILNGKSYKYHSDCGTFNDIINQTNLSMSDEKKKVVNNILEKYITLNFDTPIEEPINS